MSGKSLKELNFTQEIVPTYYAVKESVFPFNKFPAVDPILGPEMKSTGEVMGGLGDSFDEAFAKAALAVGERLPAQGVAFMSVRDVDKPGAASVARDLVDAGFRIIATTGTAKALEAEGIAVERVNKVREGRPHIVDAIKNGQVQLIINTTEGRKAISDSAQIRQSALQTKVTYTTTLAGGEASAGPSSLARSEPFVASRNYTQESKAMADRVPMTKTGEDRLREELKKLKSEDRPRVIAAIADAREHGDLKENAEYHAAREQQSFIEGRIQEIEGKLSVAQVIDVTTMENTGKVIFGTTVHLVNMETDEEVTYQIVGEDEADIKAGKLSVSSPIARALIGKNEGGDVVAIRIPPSGTVEYEISEVEYI